MEHTTGLSSEPAKHGEDTAKRRQILDCRLDTADRSVEALRGFPRALVGTAGASVSAPDDADASAEAGV